MRDRPMSASGHGRVNGLGPVRFARASADRELPRYASDTETRSLPNFSGAAQCAEASPLAFCERFRGCQLGNPPVSEAIVFGVGLGIMAFAASFLFGRIVNSASRWSRLVAGGRPSAPKETNREADRDRQFAVAAPLARWSICDDRTEPIWWHVGDAGQGAGAERAGTGILSLQARTAIRKTPSAVPPRRNLAR